MVVSLWRRFFYKENYFDGAQPCAGQSIFCLFHINLRNAVLNMSSLVFYA